MGSVSITGEAMRLMTKYKIGATFLSSNGRFNGSLSFGESKNVFLRQKQYRILDSPNQSLKIARSIVSGKIRNQLSFMQRIKRKGGITEQNVFDAISSVKRALEGAEKTGDIEKLRGFEGIASKHYFSVFGYNIQPEWAEFKTRSKNPPRTNVNAVLSFLYTLLLYRVESAIESQGLDICAGNLHALNYGKNALAFDLMEEFRSPIADSCCCSLFNLGTLKEDDFELIDFSEDDVDYPLETSIPPDSSIEKSSEEKNIKGVLLNKAGLKKVIAAFEQKMESVILYAPSGVRLPYKKIIYAQVEHYKRVVSGEETEYKSYYFK